MPRVTKSMALNYLEEWLFSTIESKYGHNGYRKLMAAIIVRSIRDNDKDFFYTDNFKAYSKFIGLNGEKLRQICLLGFDDYKKLYNGIKKN